MAIETVGTPGAIRAVPATAGHLGQGVMYPPTADKGKLRLSSGADSVNDALLSIMLTQKGERPMLPGYGAGGLLFEPVDLGRIRAEITDQITQFEPRITTARVEAELGFGVGEVVIKVTYTIAYEATPRTLTFPYFTNTNS